jgi:hypothetical protein
MTVRTGAWGRTEEEGIITTYKKEKQKRDINGKDFQEKGTLQKRSLIKNKSLTKYLQINCLPQNKCPAHKRNIAFDEKGV